MTTQPLLEILAPQRPIISLFGTAYELCTPGDFSFSDQARLMKHHTRSAALKVRLTELLSDEDDESDTLQETLEALAKIVRSMVKMVVRDLENSVLERLTDTQCAMILQSVPKALGSAETIPMAQTDSSSQDSSGTTEEMSAAG